MRNGLKLFGAFDGLFLEARVGGKVKQDFIKQYAVRSGVSVENDNAFMVRTKNGWQGGCDLRAYFEAPLWVVESLRKIGFRIVKRQIDMEKYEGGLREYSWKVCSSELFWWLVDYGYKVGKNLPISFTSYQLKQQLKTVSYETAETENIKIAV